MTHLGEWLEYGKDAKGRRKKPVKMLKLRCNHCGKIFNRRRVLRDVNRSHHYDTRECRYAAMKSGGTQFHVLRNSNLRLHGVEFPSQDAGIRKKAVQTWIEKYGVDNPAKSEIVKDRAEKTSYERYGNRYAIASDTVKEKIRKTSLERYGTISPASTYITGSYESSKAGTVFYRSSYELHAYKVLDADKTVISYMTEPFGIPYTYEGKQLNYYPDILAEKSGGIKLLIEVKPRTFVNKSITIIKAEAAKAFCKQNNMMFKIWTEEELFEGKNS